MNHQTTSSTTIDDKQYTILRLKATKPATLSTLLSNKFYNCTICGTVVGVVIFFWATLNMVSHPQSLATNCCIHVKLRIHLQTLCS